MIRKVLIAVLILFLVVMILPTTIPSRILVTLKEEDFYSSFNGGEVIMKEITPIPTSTPILTNIVDIVKEEDILLKIEESKVKIEEFLFSQLAPTTLEPFGALVTDEGENYDDVMLFLYPSNDTYKVTIGLYYKIVTIYEKDSEGLFTIPVRYMICIVGKEETSTPVGIFKVGETKVRWGQFEDYINSFAQYWTNITGDYYIHSIIYSLCDANHYTEKSYKGLGEAISHGCVRLLPDDAMWFYYNIAPGTVVEIIEGEENKEQENIRNQILENLPDYPEERQFILAGSIPNNEQWWKEYVKKAEFLNNLNSDSTDKKIIEMK